MRDVRSSALRLMIIRAIGLNQRSTLRASAPYRRGPVERYGNRRTAALVVFNSAEAERRRRAAAAKAEEEKRRREAEKIDLSKLAELRTLRAHSKTLWRAASAFRSTFVMMWLHRRSSALWCFRTGGASFLRRPTRRSSSGGDPERGPGEIVNKYKLASLPRAPARRRPEEAPSRSGRTRTSTSPAPPSGSTARKPMI